MENRCKPTRLDIEELSSVLFREYPNKAIPNQTPNTTQMIRNIQGQARTPTQFCRQSALYNTRTSIGYSTTRTKIRNHSHSIDDKFQKNILYWYIGYCKIVK